MTDLPDLLDHVPVSDSAKAAVQLRLRESHRHYHDLEHVLEMWRWHLEYSPGRPDDEITRLDDAVVASFCLYHDAIYDPTQSDNEAQSARLWSYDSQGAPGAVRLAVHDIILGSQDHFCNRCRGGHWYGPLCLRCWCFDLDLRRLAVPEARFCIHGEALRQEYGAGNGEWLKRSAEFRAKAMSQPHIFAHRAFAAAEAQARHNLAKALIKDWRGLGYL
jgi:predicted metal-dependent HD superfamily phosphohydrolase